MELFKTDCLKKEYEEFINIHLPNVYSCGLCNKKSCKNHLRYEITCSLCKNEKCKNCYSFFISKDILINSSSKETKDYLYNYILTFLNLDNETLLNFFPDIKKIETINKEFFIKRVKSEKNSTKTINQKLPINIRNGQFNFKGWKRKFYYKTKVVTFFL